MPEDTPQLILNRCPNCAAFLPGEAVFCPQCGQKQTHLHHSAWEVAVEFLESHLNLNSRLLVTLGKLVKNPGLLALDYVQGRRARYLSPVRLFLFLSLLLLAGLVVGPTVGLHSLYPREKLKALLFLDSLRNHPPDTAILFSAQSRRGICDSLLRRQHKNWEAALDSAVKELQNIRADSLDIAFEEKTIKIPLEDLILLSEDEILNKYQIKGFWPRVLLRKTARLLHDTDKFFIDFIQSKLWWVIVLMIPLMALALRLVFGKSPYYFAEHLVLSFYYHNIVLLTTLPILFWPREVPDNVLLIIGIIWLLYLFLSLKAFYNKKWSITLGKGLVIVMISGPSIIFSSVLVLLISIILF